MSPRTASTRAAAPPDEQLSLFEPRVQWRQEAETRALALDFGPALAAARAAGPAWPLAELLERLAATKPGRGQYAWLDYLLGALHDPSLGVLPGLEAALAREAARSLEVLEVSERRGATVPSLLARAGNRAEAFAWARRQARDADDWRALAELAWAYGDGDEARDAWSAALTLAPLSVPIDGHPLEALEVALADVEEACPATDGPAELWLLPVALHRNVLPIPRGVAVEGPTVFGVTGTPTERAQSVLHVVVRWARDRDPLPARRAIAALAPWMLRLLGVG